MYRYFREGDVRIYRGIVKILFHVRV